jgi:hypothetical protein
MIHKGRIKGFNGSWNSGLAFLTIEDSDTGLIETVPCDNGPVVRALEGAFGEVISPGHSVNLHGGHIDQEIFWSYDEFGLTLGGFTKVEDAHPAVIEAYEGGEE